MSKGCDLNITQSAVLYGIYLKIENFLSFYEKMGEELPI
jgi:hypothetical protein